MRRFALAFHALSVVIMAFAFAFLVPMGWSVVDESWSHVLTWVECFVFTLACGYWLWLRTREARGELDVRNGFLLVNLVWLVLPAFAAVPLMFTVQGITWTHAYFEAMSGLTASGATVLSGVDVLAPSVNVWRCFLQWLGGLGIMLLAVAVLPFLGLGGMQLYKAEVPGPMKDTRLSPRIAQTARGLWVIYFLLSVACTLAYRWGGMTWSDAFMHMCGTVGLGGLSSHDAGFGYWHSPTLEWIAILFMLLSGISFARYFMVWRGRSFKPITHDAEIRWYAIAMLGATALVAVMLLASHAYASWSDTIRIGAFEVVSMATTTGFGLVDYMPWPSFVPVLLLLLGCFVSCAGSTGGGIKMVRMIVLVRLATRELARIVHPHIVNPVTLNGATIPQPAVAAVMAFMLIYGGVTVLLTLVLLATGMDVITAASAIVSCLNNIGPALGEIGAAGNYGELSNVQLWVITWAFVLGRLELLSVLVILTPQFWRR